MSLNEKQKRFAKEYLIDLNATQAAIRAGYAEKTAYSQGQRLLKHVEIEALIRKEKTNREKRTEINADWVLKQAVELHQRCMQEVKPKMVKIGKEMVHAEDDDGNKLYVFDSKGAASSLKLVGDHVNVSAYKNVVQHTGEINMVNIDKDDQGLVG